MLLSTAYFPPIQFFTKIIDQDSFTLEAHENYQKQSYRNRFIIYAANGPASFSIPVLRGRSSGQIIKDVKLDYSERWNIVQMRTLKSAYQHSPFYEFYIDDLLHFWEKKWDFLFDHNLQIIHTLLEMMDLQIEVEESERYNPMPDSEEPDLRALIHPKVDWRNDPSFFPEPYTQNFADKHGFQANLSIIDLLFQTGPDAVRVIKNSKKD